MKCVKTLGNGTCDSHTDEAIAKAGEMAAQRRGPHFFAPQLKRIFSKEAHAVSAEDKRRIAMILEFLCFVSMHSKNYMGDAGVDSEAYLVERRAHLAELRAHLPSYELPSALTKIFDKRALDRGAIPEMEGVVHLCKEGADGYLRKFMCEIAEFVENHEVKTGPFYDHHMRI